MVCFYEMNEVKYGQTFGIDEVTSLPFKFVLCMRTKSLKKRTKMNYVLASFEQFRLNSLKKVNIFSKIIDR